MDQLRQQQAGERQKGQSCQRAFRNPLFVRISHLNPCAGALIACREQARAAIKAPELILQGPNTVEVVGCEAPSPCSCPRAASLEEEEDVVQLMDGDRKAQRIQQVLYDVQGVEDFHDEKRLAAP